MQFVMPTSATPPQQQQQQHSSQSPVPQTAAPPQTSSNNNNNPFGIPTASNGVPLFTVEQLQMLQRQALLSRISQQQQLQHQQQQQLSQQYQSQTPSRPFMVVTQVPVQAMALFASAAAAGSNMSTTSNVTGASMANNNANSTAQSDGGDWANFLQPTPLSPQYEQQQNQNKHPHQQGQVQGQVQGHSSSPSRNSSSNPPGPASQQAAASLEHHFQQLSQQEQPNKNPETEELLKQLLRNAQAASQQQNQPPIKQQQHQLPMKQQQQLYALSSGVEPLQVNSSTNSSNNDPFQQDSFAWKMFMDEEEDPMKGANKRKLEGDPSVNQTMLLGSTTASWGSSNKSNESSQRRSPLASAPPTNMQHSLAAPLADDDKMGDQADNQNDDDNDPMLDPTPLSEILSMRADSPDDDGLSLSDRMQKQFQLQQQTQGGGGGGSNNSPHSVPAQVEMQQQQPQQPQQQARGNNQRGIGPRGPTSVSSELQPHPVSSSSTSSSTFLLPSTMVPPSVLASVLPSKTAVASPSSSSQQQQHNPKQRKVKRQEAPQHVLERMLQARGSRVTRIKAEEAGYDTTPSPLQLASFGTQLVQAIHTSNAALLGKLLSAGLSPNPCNQFRDSIVDLVCKRGNFEIFRTLVEHGCDVQVCDGFGRTPLHHTCWASDFCKPIAQLILEQDWMQLLIEDKRGQTPLEYVRPDLAQAWVEFLEGEADKYLPGSIDEVGAPKLKRMRDDDGHLLDPPNALPVQLASAVSSGQMTVEEVQDLSPEVRAQFQ